MSSIQLVSLILPSHASYVPTQLVSELQPGSVSTGRILGSPSRLQEGPLGFILIREPRSTIDGHIGGLIARHPKLWGKGDEDVEQHWFL